MMRGIVGPIEQHHHVRILTRRIVAVRAIEPLYPGRQLPDKSVSLLDTACARVAMSHAATPPPVEDRRRRDEQLGVSIGVFEREAVTGKSHEDKLAEMKAQRVEVQGELKSLEAQWEKEKELVAKIRDLRDRLEGRPPGAKPPVAGKAPEPSKPAGTRRQGRRDCRCHRTAAGRGKTARAHAGRTAKTFHELDEVATELTNCKARHRWCKFASIRRPWPTWSLLGPEFPSVGWFRTKFKPF